MIPIPPSHCIIALHIKILFGLSSRLVITVEPVVVIPDILSKKASLNVRFRFEKINGILPKIAIANHAKVENKKVCCRLSLNSFSKLVKMNNIPIKIVINEDEKKL
jgi:hypothetical protein